MKIRCYSSIFRGNDIPLTRAWKVCVPGGSCEMNRFWCGGDIQAQKASGIPGMRQHSSDILRIACTSSISSLNRHKFELSFNKSTLFFKKKIIYIYVLPGPPSSRLRLLLWCSSVLGRTGQWGRGAEKADPRWVYCIKCSAHCSDWLMPTEASGLKTRAAGGGGSRADTRFNLAPALLALFGIVKDCASAWVVF